jgi:hydroxymethylbilane synthase
MTFVLNEYTSGKKQLVIASRKSDLARLQSYTVGKVLKFHYPDLNIKYQFRESLGDINLNDPLWKMPEKGVFTEDFYQDLIQHRVDLVVHSWKDLPIEDKEKTHIVATLKREDARDVLLFKKTSLQKKSLNIFTSSPRRIYNLENFFNWSLPWSFDKLEFQSVRGNIQTRVRKLMESDTDGLIVAKAAIDRLISAEEPEFIETKNFLKLALKELQFQVLPLSQNPTAAAQGALAIEVAKDRTELSPLFEKINDKIAYHNVSLERSILKRYGGGCHQKIGISILNKNNHTALFLKGLTDSKLVLNQNTLLETTEPKLNVRLKSSLKTQVLHKLLTKRVTPVSYDLGKFYNLKEPRYIFITKNENIKDLTAQDILWTSGVSTWQSLVKTGHWVSGCFDSLGEESAPNIKNLLSKADDLPLKWIKLTHSSGKSSHWAHKVTTYAVTYDDMGSFYNKDIDCYFWSHGELFKDFFQKFPEIKNKLHACGLGSTFDTIKEYINEENIIPCLNFDDWKNKIETK